jgi:hypothetical protein
MIGKKLNYTCVFFISAPVRERFQREEHESNSIAGKLG